MTDHLVHHRSPFDDWRSISIAIYMSLVGYGVLVGIPVISTAWVEQLGFTEVQVGRVAGADLGGLSVGAVLAALFIAQVNRRWLVVISAAIAIGANLACIVITDYQPVLWLRFLAGFGSGVYTAVAIATLGATSRPAWTFNLLLFAFAFTQVGELYFLPKLSMSGIYTVFIVSYVLGLLFLKWLPSRPTERSLDVEVEHDGEIEHQHVPAYAPWLVLGAIVATYINIGAYWTYIELASADSAADPDWVGTVLVWTSGFSVLGCLFATVISDRFGLARPMLVTLVCQAIIVVMLANGINNVNIVVSMFAFNFLWIFIDVYQMATVANMDPSGRFAALMPGAQGLGQILGPNIAASILAAGLGYRGVFIMCGLASLTAMAIYLLMYLRLRRQIPALADAT
ncbi:MAG: MFS transporter [Pseudomonadota bacterium]